MSGFFWRYRLAWILIFLVATAIFVYLVIDSLKLLLSHPKNVDVSVEFNDKIEFPAVTICNLNKYRSDIFILLTNS